MVRAPVPTNLDLAPQVDGHRVGELERVEVGVRDDGRVAVVGLDLLELAEHLGPRHAPDRVRDLDDRAAAPARLTRLDPHVELAW